MRRQREGVEGMERTVEKKEIALVPDLKYPSLSVVY